MEQTIILSGVGLWTPENTLSNEELIASYNEYADHFNETNSADIAAGTIDAKPHSSAEFVEKASGIKSRYIYCKEGVLDIHRMRPKLDERSDDELSHQAEMAIAASKKALKAANKLPSDIDAVIVSCAYTQRSYPAIAIEVQEALGIEGFGFDMLVACSAATFGMHRAYEMVAAGTARAVLVVNPELVSPQINYTDRLFHQAGRKVFKEVCPLAAEHITQHLSAHDLRPTDLKRWWLHQANINMNTLISKKLLGREATKEEAPIVLDTYANTASAGSVIAFALHHQDLTSGDYGVLCSFGAGYSIGSLLLQKR